MLSNLSDVSSLLQCMYPFFTRMERRWREDGMKITCHAKGLQRLEPFSFCLLFTFVTSKMLRFLCLLTNYSWFFMALFMQTVKLNLMLARTCTSYQTRECSLEENYPILWIPADAERPLDVKSMLDMKRSSNYLSSTWNIAHEWVA